MGTAPGHRTITGRGLVLAAVLVMTPACDSSSRTAARTTGPDCPAQLRYDGATYTAFHRYRFAHAQPTELGSATPVCAGTTIAAGHSVTVWTLPGGSPTDVVGRRVYPRRFVVYVADSVRRADRTRILAAVAATR